MISIREVFKRVQDLSRKDRSGYMSSEEFTRDVNEAQDILMQYYYNQFEERQIIVDALMPFIKEDILSIVESPLGNYCEFPEDYRHRIEAGFNIVENQADKCDVKNPTIDPIELGYLHSNEVRKTYDSAIRKPSAKKKQYYHSFANNRIQIHPRDSQGTITFKYIIDPPDAIYATTVNPITDKEDFDPANSIDLIWLSQDLNNIVDIMLLFKGLEVRESALIAWVQQKKQITNANSR